MAPIYSCQWYVPEVKKYTHGTYLLSHRCKQDHLLPRKAARLPDFHKIRGLLSLYCSCPGLGG